MVSQWNHKAHYAYAGRSQSQLLERDALAALAAASNAAATTTSCWSIPCPGRAPLAAMRPAAVLQQRGTPDDSTAGRQAQNAQPSTTPHPITAEKLDIEMASRVRSTIGPVEVPAFGYVVVPRRDVVEYKYYEGILEDRVIETPRYRLVFDRERGGLASWYDSASSEYEWIDSTAPYAFNGFVHEEVADRNHPRPATACSI